MLGLLPAEMVWAIVVASIVLMVGGLVIFGFQVAAILCNRRKPVKPLESGEKKPDERAERLIISADVWSYLFTHYPRTAVALCRHNIETAVMTTDGRRIKLSFDFAAWNMFPQDAIESELDREQFAEDVVRPCLVFDGTPEICFKRSNRYPIKREMLQVRQIPHCCFMADAALFGGGPYQAPRRVSLRQEGYTLFIKSCGAGGCSTIKKDVDEFFTFTPSMVWLAHPLPVLAPPSQPLDKPYIVP